MSGRTIISGSHVVFALEHDIDPCMPMRATARDMEIVSNYW